MDKLSLEKLNESMKRLDFIDFKLSQFASFTFGVMLVKIFPFLRKIGFKKILFLMIFSSGRPVYKFFSHCNVDSDIIEDISEK